MDGQERWYLHELDLKGQVIADVGANVGRLSEFFFRRGGGATRVVSIEPLPRNVKAIEARLRKAGPAAKKRWTIARCAVSAEDGRVTLRTVRAEWGDNAVVAPGRAGDDVLEVRCRPLAAIVPDATLVKLDIEGHEYAILPAALEALPGVHTWALELHAVNGQPLEATLGRLVDAGFALVAAGRRRDDPDGVWQSVPLDPTLTWDAIPGTPSVHDGIPGVFKMLHVLARR